MNCPECDSKMAPERHSGITIDRCMGCQGLWFDPGELEHYLQAMTAPDRSLEISFEAEAAGVTSPLAAAQPSIAAARSSLTATESPLPPRLLDCPKCRSALVRGKSGDIALSRCGGCQGFYVSADDVLAVITGGKISANRSTLRVAADIVEIGVMSFGDLLIEILS